MKKKKLLFAALASVSLLLPSLQADSKNRVFTSKEGKTMEAQLISATDKTVRVKLAANNRVIDFPINVLSTEDQGFVAKWAEANKKYSLRIEARKKNKGSENTKNGNTKVNEKNYVYEVSVDNLGREKIEDLTVRYRVFLEDCYKEGSYSLGAMEQKANNSFETLASVLTQSKTVTMSGGG